MAAQFSFNICGSYIIYILVKKIRVCSDNINDINLFVMTKPVIPRQIASVTEQAGLSLSF